MNLETFRERFHTAAVSACAVARTCVRESLPEAMLFRLLIKRSNNLELLPDERVYPEDCSFARERELNACNEEVAVSALWRKGAIPEWVDVSVTGILHGATLIEVRVCSRFTENRSLLYHARDGHPPFHVLSPTLPLAYENGEIFSIYSTLCDCYTIAAAREIEPHDGIIGVLTLVGDEFGDAGLADLPSLPTLSQLVFRHVPIRGWGLSALARYPRLTDLRLSLSDVQDFTIQHLPPYCTIPNRPWFRGLGALEVLGLPSAPWGFGTLAEKAPKLSALNVMSEGELVFDGEFPQTLSELKLMGRSIQNGVKLPRSLKVVSLHLREGSSQDVEELFSEVTSLEFLSLEGIRVDETCLFRLATKFQLKEVCLYSTGLDDSAISRLKEAFPKTLIVSYL